MKEGGKIAAFFHVWENRDIILPVRIGNGCSNYITHYLHTTVAGGKHYRIWQKVELRKCRIRKRVVDIEMVAATGKIRYLCRLFRSQFSKAENDLKYARITRGELEGGRDGLWGDHIYWFANTFANASSAALWPGAECNCTGN